MRMPGFASSTANALLAALLGIAAAVIVILVVIRPF